jgi:poly-gamma-glutamate synthesis protein (capsule biosynthesis protein)
MPERVVRFQAVGDIAFGDHPLCAGFGTHSRAATRPPTFVFEHVAGEFSRADLLFGNLECTLSQSGLQRLSYGSMQMRGHPAYVEGLRAAGFDVLNHANNHSMQHGPTPFRETVAMVAAAGIAVCGVRAAHGGAEPVVIEKNGLRVAFLGYSLRPRQYFTETPLYAEGDRPRILEDVRGARVRSDVVVVSFHWGDEFIDRPSPSEIALARETIDAGANLIVGHHPHVLRGVERYGRGYIVYSLGNFVCDMLWDEPVRETAILECRLGPEGVSELRLIPVRINAESQPIPLAGPAAEALGRRLAALSAPLASHPGAASPPGAQEKYDADAHEAHAYQRRRSHRYFLKNAYRFPPRLIVQQIITFVRNRLKERGLVKASPAEFGH